jgi:vitamin B12 transporter
MLQGDTLHVVDIIGTIHSSSTVFEGELIELEGSERQSSLIKVLQLRTSVYIKDGGPGLLSSSSYRGGSSQHQVLLWNGMEISSPSLGLTDLNIFPGTLYERMELNSGAGALLKGNGVFGLALDMLTTENDQKEGICFDVIANPVLSQLGNSLAIKEKVGPVNTELKFFRVTAENAYRYDDDTGPETIRRERSHAAMENWAVTANISYPTDKSGIWNLSLQRTGLEREVPVLIGTTPRGEALNDDHVRAMLLWNSELRSWKTEWALGYSEEKQIYMDSLSDLNSQIEAKLWHSRWIGTKDFRTIGRLRFKLSLDQNEVSTENYSAPQGRQTLGFFAEWERKFGHLALNLSARQAWVDQSSIPLTSSFGLRYLKDKWDLHASIAKMYRLPTLNDLYWNPGGNADLKPEEGWMWDAGLNLRDEPIEVGLTYFWNRYQDMIVWQPTDMGYWSPLNRNLLSNQGIELTLAGQVIPGLKAHGAATFLNLIQWQQSDMDLSFSERVPVYYPLITARGALSYQFDSHEFRITQQMNGKVYADLSNLTEVPASFPMDITYSYQVLKEESLIQMGVGVLNVLNESYAFILGRPLPGRTIQFTITYRIPSS